MSDPFALFGLTPNPALDLDALKTQFTQTTAAAHPDKFQAAPEAERIAAETKYAELNQAFQLLSDPKTRLLLLYERINGTKPRDVQRIPPGTMDLFIEVGQVCQNLDSYLERKREASGALARAALMGEELTLQETLMTLGGKLQALAATLATELTAFGETWRAAPDPKALLPKLEELYRKYAYLARWRQQLEEREIALLTGE